MRSRKPNGFLHSRMPVSRRIRLGNGISSRTVQNSAHDLQKVRAQFHLRHTIISKTPPADEVEMYWLVGASILRLLTGLRSECLRWIEKAATQESLVRECASLPLL
jgi:hypothetical protein